MNNYIAIDSTMWQMNITAKSFNSAVRQFRKVVGITERIRCKYHYSDVREYTVDNGCYQFTIKEVLSNFRRY